MNRGSSPNGFSGLSSLRTAVQTRRRMPEREFHISSFPHTKGRRRGSCVVPSASITSKSHDNTINPHFPSLYSWLPPCAVPLAGTCRPAGSQLAAAISSQSQQDELMNNFSLLVMFFIKQEYFLVIS